MNLLGVLMRHRVVIPALVLLVLSGSPLIWGQTPARDSGVFLYSGSQVLAGSALYRDLWDHKPPGIHLLNALGLTLGGGSPWGVWLLEAALLLATAFLAHRLLRSAFGELPALLGTWAWLLGLVRLLDGGNLPEEYGLPLQFAALWLIYARERSPGRSRYDLLLGAAGAGAFLIKQNLVGLWIVFGLFIIIRSLRERQWGELFRTAFWGTAGALLTLLPVLIYLWRADALFPFWDAAFGYNFAYSGASLGRRLLSIYQGYTLLASAGLAIMAVGGWLSTLWLLRSGQESSRPVAALLWVALGALPLESLLAGLSGRGYPHYWMPLLPISAVLTAALVRTLTREGEAGGGLRFELRAPVLAALLAGMSLLPLLHLADTALVRFSSRGHSAAVAVINSQTRPGDSVLVWGAEPSLNLLSGRPSPSRYFYQYPLFTAGYGSAAMMDALMAELTARPPELIVDTTSERGPVAPLDGTLRQNWRPDPGYAAPAGLDRLDRFIQEQYQPAGLVAGTGWRLYQRLPR